MGAGANLETQQTDETNGRNEKEPESLLFRRGRRVVASTRVSGLDLFGQKAKLIDASRTDFVDDGDDGAVLGASIAFDVDGFVELIGDLVFNLRRDLFFGDLVVAEVDVVVARDRNDDGVVLSASCISRGLLTVAISTETPFCNMGVTTMKMISSTSMMSAIGMTLGAAICAPA